MQKTNNIEIRLINCDFFIHNIVKKSKPFFCYDLFLQTVKNNSDINHINKF